MKASAKEPRFDDKHRRIRLHCRPRSFSSCRRLIHNFSSFRRMPESRRQTGILPPRIGSPIPVLDSGLRRNDEGKRRDGVSDISKQQSEMEFKHQKCSTTFRLTGGCRYPENGPEFFHHKLGRQCRFWIPACAGKTRRNA